MPTRMVGHTNSDINQSTRQQRNLAEKQRRDKLNGYINELANIVPLVSMSSKRLDKTSILRLSAAFLRIHNGPLCSYRKRSSNWKSHFLNAENLRDLIEAVDGFLIVTSGTGKIVYVSQSVERFLGHQHIEMIGHSIYSFIHPSDLEYVQHHLQSLAASLALNAGCRKAYEKCSFFCRVRERHQPRSEVITYQLVHVTGHMAITASTQVSNNESHDPSGQPSDLMLKAFVCVVQSNPYTELSLSDALQDEYVTRHGLDGTIVFADHRISTITGHLPHEVRGVSAYNYILKEDLSLSLFAHKLMFTSNSGCGFVIYRLRTKSGGFVYLKTNGYLQYDKTTGQAEQFICVNHLLHEDEGDEELKKFCERYTPHVQNSSPAALFRTLQYVQKVGLRSPHYLYSEEEMSPSGKKSPTLSDEEIAFTGSIHVTRLSHTNFSSGNYEHVDTVLYTRQESEKEGLSQLDNYPQSTMTIDDPLVMCSSIPSHSENGYHAKTSAQDPNFSTDSDSYHRAQSDNGDNVGISPDTCSTTDVNKVVSSAMNSLISNSTYDDNAAILVSDCSDARAPSSYSCTANPSSSNSTKQENVSSSFHITDLSESVVQSSTYKPLLSHCQYNRPHTSDDVYPENQLISKSPDKNDLVLRSKECTIHRTAQKSILHETVVKQEHPSENIGNQYFNGGYPVKVENYDSVAAVDVSRGSYTGHHEWDHPDSGLQHFSRRTT